MSTLLQRLALAVRAGLQFGTDRDLYKVFGYKQNPNYQDYLARYYRQDVASRIIDLPVTATWRRGVTIMDDDGEEGKFSQAWKSLAIEHSIYHFLERVDRLSGLGHFAVLLLGTDAPGKLDTPLKKADNLIYLQPYGEGSTKITAFDSSETSPRFGRPTAYEVEIADPTLIVKQPPLPQASRNTKKLKVHFSRVLHVAEATLEDAVLATPRMLKVYNLLDDLLKVVGGSAETFWLTANRGMQADIDKEMQLDEDEETALADEIEEYQHQLRRWIRTRGVKITSLGGEVADPTGVFLVLIGLVAGSYGIPVRILLGSERGELASEQDRANWANRVEERRETYAEPLILRPFIGMLTSTGILVQPNGEIATKWPDPFAPSPLEAGQTRAQNARAATNLTKTLESEASPITRDEARTILGLKADTKAVDLPDADNEPREPNEPGTAGAGNGAAIRSSS